MNLTLVIILFVFRTLTVFKSNPIAHTNVGIIRGLRASDGEYSMFMGIPYATVDRANPFGISTPAEGFDYMFEAYDDSAACPQVNDTNYQIIGDLDCLRLNVYVPDVVESQNKVPVLLWIYGGGFYDGEASRLFYGPKYLVKHDVILVTINYRLGPYGFMCLDIPEIPGNQGMKDQLIALRWVKNNIEAFGGDSNRITLFGESAGGISIDLHLLSNNELLFNNVIYQSGTSLASTVIVEPDKKAPIKIAEKLGYITESINDALLFLVNSNVSQVIAAADAKGIVFKPCVELKFDNVEPFLTNHWINAAIPKVKDLPILIGFSDKEKFADYYFFGSKYFDNMNIIRTKLTQTFNFTNSELNEMENNIRNFYLGDSNYSITLRNEIADFDSDYTYIHPTIRSIRKYLEAEAKNIYLYMFSYKGKRNLIQFCINVTVDGALHADNLSYLFDQILIPEKPNAEDQTVIDRMTTMWTNFAKYNDPIPTTSDLLPVKWPALSNNKWPYMNIGKELTVGFRPLHARMAYWDLFYKLNERKQKGYFERSVK